MNTSKTRGEAGPRPQAEADLSDTVQAIFRRLGALQGFSVQDAARVPASREAGQLEGDLSLADIATFPVSAADACFGEIAISLIDLLDERPEARELLRGRTFTRTQH
jgi:hypothetical protein